MPNQFEQFIKVLKALEDYQVDYVLIGGVAVILHGLDRLTSDIDIFIQNEAENINRLKQALNSIFNDTSIEEISKKLLDDYSVIRYGTTSDFNIDIIDRIGELFKYSDLEFEIINNSGVKIRVATAETLFKLKKDTIRLNDQADAFFLMELIKKKNQRD